MKQQQQKATQIRKEIKIHKQQQHTTYDILHERNQIKIEQPETINTQPEQTRNQRKQQTNNQ